MVKNKQSYKKSIKKLNKYYNSINFKNDKLILEYDDNKKLFIVNYNNYFWDEAHLKEWAKLLTPNGEIPDTMEFDITNDCSLILEITDIMEKNSFSEVEIHDKICELVFYQTKEVYYPKVIYLEENGCEDITFTYIKEYEYVVDLINDYIDIVDSIVNESLNELDKFDYNYNYNVMH